MAATATMIQNTSEQKATDAKSEIKGPKNCKENRYYYRHREEILASRKEKRLEDPVYQAKQIAKQEAKEKRAEEKKIKREVEIQERAKVRAEAKAKMLGLKSKSPSGVEISASK